jgi:hypothetical protein
VEPGYGAGSEDEGELEVVPLYLGDHWDDIDFDDYDYDFDIDDGILDEHEDSYGEDAK